MWKSAVVLLAAIWILPVPATEASPPESERPVWAPAPDPDPAISISISISIAGSAEAATVLVPRVLLQRVRRASAAEGRGGVCLAAGRTAAPSGTAPSDLCDFGVFVTRSKPCLAAGDCPAYEAWDKVMGAPGIRAAPESAVRAAVWMPEWSDPPERE